MCEFNSAGLLNVSEVGSSYSSKDFSSFKDVCVRVRGTFIFSKKISFILNEFKFYSFLFKILFCFFFFQKGFFSPSPRAIQQPKKRGGGAVKVFRRVEHVLGWLH